MRKLFLVGLGLVAALYVLPAAHLVRGGDDPLAIHLDELTVPDALPVAQPETSGEDNAAASTDHSTVTVEIDGKPTELPLETYVAGVVAAEVPATFPIEAIRAQAVAARTYAVYKLDRGRPDAHPNADLCNDFRHCAAYRAEAVTASADDGLDRVRQAVKDTAGQIVTYDGAPIAAVFHCASAPRTEAAKDVWGEDVPYLQSVVSPGGASCDAYEDTVTLSADEFRKTVGSSFPTADLSGPPNDWFKASVRSDAGGVETVQLGGLTVEGTAVRTLFGLHSTNFTITTTDDSISFHTVGYGHGVGLSQYGARYMAEQGADYKEILQHYYTETEIGQV